MHFLACDVISEEFRGEAPRALNDIARSEKRAPNHLVTLLLCRIVTKLNT